MLDRVREMIWLKVQELRAMCPPDHHLDHLEPTENPYVFQPVWAKNDRGVD